MHTGAGEDAEERTDRITDRPPPPDDPLIGAVLGERYTIVRKEFEDETTVVYVATNPRVVGSEVLLHLLAPTLRASKEECARYRTTWELYTLFDGVRDHTLRVEDLWSDDLVGTLVVATEVPSGYRLDEWLLQTQSPPSAERAIEWARQLALVLDAMHGQGVAHGDLRPEVVRLVNVGPYSILKLTSFGTRRQGRQVAHLGAGPYRAPEHRVKREVVGIKADVWSYGMIVCELLTGRRFWREDEATLWQGAGVALPLLSERASHLQEQAAVAFATWLKTCLSVVPRDRFPDVMEAWRALRACLTPRSLRLVPRELTPHRGTVPPPEPGVLVREKPQILRGHAGTVWGVVIAHDGSTILSVGDDGVVRVWDPVSGVLLDQHAPVHVGRVRCIAVTADGAQVVTGGQDRAIVLRSLRDRATEPVRLVHHRSIVTSLTLSYDGAWMLTTSEDGTAIAWDLAARRAMWATPAGDAALYVGAIGTDGDTFFTAGRDGIVRRWSLRERRCVATLDGTGDIYAIALSADRNTLYAGGRSGRVSIWREGVKVGELLGPRDAVTSLALGVGEHWIAAGTSDPDVHIWSTSTKRCLQTLSGHEWAVRSVAADTRGRFLVSGGSDGDLRVWTTGG